MIDFWTIISFMLFFVGFLIAWGNDTKKSLDTLKSIKESTRNMSNTEEFIVRTLIKYEQIRQICWKYYAILEKNWKNKCN